MRRIANYRVSTSDHGIESQRPIMDGGFEEQFEDVLLPDVASMRRHAAAACSLVLRSYVHETSESGCGPAYKMPT